MKYLLGLLSILLIVCAFINAWNNPMANIALSVPFTNLTILTNSFVYVVCVFVAGFIAGSLFGSVFLISQKEKLSPYKRQFEKMSVIKDSNEAKVQALEAKIKTLESALEQAIENK